VVCDEEALPFRDASLDLITSGLSLQFVNDLPTRWCRSGALKRGGFSGARSAAIR
jgi:hypothetical protein